MHKTVCKIVCFHLLNDFSGSPKVLSQAIDGLVQEGYTVDLFTCRNGDKGFLSGKKGVNYHYFSYRWSRFKWVTLFNFLWSQLNLMFRLLQYRNQQVIFYVNTVLPFGAGLVGKLMGKRVVYHIHETSIKPELFKRFLFGIAHWAADQKIHVSQYLLDQEETDTERSEVIYNSLSQDFLEKANKAKVVRSKPFTVLMLCSLKAYKGVIEFVRVAQQLPGLQFELVLNASKEEIHTFFMHEDIPGNLALFPSQSDVHPFYRRASLVLNLSLPDQWVETFGLTALEAMSYGLPVIVPPVGGITELVNHGENGYQMDPRDVGATVEKIHELEASKDLYHRLSENALSFSKDFSPGRFHRKIKHALFSTREIHLDGRLNEHYEILK